MSNESIEIKIAGSRKEEGYVCERFYCHAVIEKAHLKNIIIFTFDIAAKFIDPHVDVNKFELNFSLDVTSDSIQAFLKGFNIIISLKNGQIINFRQN